MCTCASPERFVILKDESPCECLRSSICCDFFLTCRSYSERQDQLECNAWVYDQSEFVSTIISEVNMSNILLKIQNEFSRILVWTKLH